MAGCKIWFVAFPTYQYNEDVVGLADRNGLCIRDARFDDGTGVSDVPKLSIKGEKPKRGPKPKPSDGEE